MLSESLDVDGVDQVSSLLAEAVRTRQPAEVAAFVAALAGQSPDARWELLENAIGDDIDRGWQQPGTGPRVEEYLDLFAEHFPEMADPDFVAHLCEVELKARCRWPDPRDTPSLGEYRDRFREYPGVVAHLDTICFDHGRYVRFGASKPGGMGRVWPARDVRMHRLVAVKEVLPDQAIHSDVLERLKNEAYITARLNHPSIVTVHEIDSGESQTPFYVMQWVEGRELTEGIRELHAATDGERALRRRHLLQALSDLSDAVAYAHDQGVIHRDLKPANVFLGNYGETILLDWGLAKAVDSISIEASGSSSTNETSAEVNSVEVDAEPGGPAAEVDTARTETLTPTVGATRFIGTPAYMAPEQVSGNVNEQSDVFSLGGILFEMLTNRRPRVFERGTPVTTIEKQIVETPIPPPIEIDPTIPRSLDAICRKATAPLASGRYATAAEFRDDIQRYLADEPVSAYRESRWEHLQRKLRARVKLAAAILLSAILVGIVATIGAAAFGWQWKEASAAREKAGENFRLAAEQRDRAEQNRAESAALAEFLWTTSADELRNIPQTAATRLKLLERTLAHYQKLASMNPREQYLFQHDIGRVLHKIAIVREELGQKWPTIAAYEAALKHWTGLLKDNPQAEQSQREMIALLSNFALLLNRVNMGERARVLLLQATKLSEALLASKPDHQPFVLMRVGTELNLGVVARGRGDRTAALRHYRKAAAILEVDLRKHPRHQGSRRQLANVRMNLAVVLDDRGEYESAAKYYLHAINDLRSIRAAEPAIREHTVDLAVAHMNLGVTYRHALRFQQADENYRKAIGDLAKLHRTFPKQLHIAHTLARCHHNLAISLRSQGKHRRNAGDLPTAKACFAAARRELAIAVALREKLVTAAPEIAEYKSMYASTLLELGRVLECQGQLDAAMNQYARSLAIQERVAAQLDRIPDALRQIADVHRNLSNLHKKRKDYTSARREVDRSEAIYKSLLKEKPELEDLRDDLAVCTRIRREILEDAGRLPEALEQNGREIAAFTALVSRRSRFQSDIATAYVARIALLGKLKKFREAVTAARAFQKTLPRFRIGLFAVAVELGGCGLRIDAGPAKTDAAGTRLKIELADECIRLLRAVDQIRPLSRKELADQKKLAFVRTRPAFQELLKSKPAKAERKR